MAKAAVEMGLWGLAATLAGQSLARFIGGTREEVATGISLGIQKSPEALIDKVRASLAEGYRKVKIKIKPGRDVEWIGAVRVGNSDSQFLRGARRSRVVRRHARERKPERHPRWVFSS